MKDLEYVLSGTSFTRLNSNLFHNDPALLAIIEAAAKKLHSNGHVLSVLYNAHMEQRSGEKLFRYPKGMFNKIHADSGGLQVITQGLEITKELKDEVYRNQGTWADFGMCFDEIPVKLAGSRSGRLDVNNRWFDREGFEPLARQTGRNVNDQFSGVTSSHSNSAQRIYES